jgi:hypothetical protein
LIFLASFPAGVSTTDPGSRNVSSGHASKTLIKMLRVLTQSAETVVSAGGAGAEPLQRNRLHKHFIRVFAKTLKMYLLHYCQVLSGRCV